MTSTIRGALRRRHPWGFGLSWAFGLAAALTSSFTTVTSAEVLVEGSPAAVRVTTSHDTVGDVLLAFAASFGVRYRSSIPLDSAASATYSGSLAEVIARLLDGYSYVIKNDRQATEIVVLTERGAVAVAPEAPKASPQGIMSRWR